MPLPPSLADFELYAKNLLYIKTKTQGLTPFHLRTYQKKFFNFVQDIKGPKRVIALKPRQAGFSTEVAAIFFWLMNIQENFKGIAMADKFGRTQDIQGIYSTYLQNLAPFITPMISKNNSEEIYFANPKSDPENPGLLSGVRFETGNDPNAGRAGSRQFAHLSENAFYRYYTEIDEGIQNSIPLDKNTYVIKESTANGRAGIGRPFFELWKAAERGETIYKPFFVAWYEIDDYQIEPPRGFKRTKEEIELCKQCPGITDAHLTWRRLKISEYLETEDGIILPAATRFDQDFPWSPTVAFLSTGAPVFPQVQLNSLIKTLSTSRPSDIKERIKFNDTMIDQYKRDLKIYSPPRRNEKYFLGADVSEGLAQGDASSVFVMNENKSQVASWHGKIDPDLFGHLLISIGKFYNNALLTVEANNMGQTTITTIRNEMYTRLYQYTEEDRIHKTQVTRFGWRTTGKTKMEMLNKGIKALRDEDCRILDLNLATEMDTVSREENGDVILNGKDRVVAYCLALSGHAHYYFPTNKTKKMKNAITHDVQIERAHKPSDKGIFD